MFTIKEVVTLFSVTLVLNACMCGPSQRNISVESVKGYLGYHLQCRSKCARREGGGWERDKVGEEKRRRNTNVLICLVLPTFKLKILQVYQEIKEL